MNYLLGTGRYKVSPEFEKIWDDNVPSVKPNAVVRLSINDGPVRVEDNRVNEVNLRGNLGHVGDLLNRSKPYDFCGWSASILALSLLAYNGEYDFIYKEQDCLAFGPWVEQVYADMGDGDMVFGRAMTSPPYMACGQSLFLIRHSFIPHFVWQYIGQGPDGRVDNLPETKFARLEEINSPGRIRRLSFGYDRERPINFNDRVWYGQKFTPQEMEELRKRCLI